MNVEWYEEPEGRGITFSGRLDYRQLGELMLHLDHVDRAVVKSQITSAADLFQTLEIIFRRQAERDALSVPEQATTS